MLSQKQSASIRRPADRAASHWGTPKSLRLRSPKAVHPFWLPETERVGRETEILGFLFFSSILWVIFEKRGIDNILPRGKPRHTLQLPFFPPHPSGRDAKPRNSSPSCMAVALLCRRAPQLAVHVQALTHFN